MTPTLFFMIGIPGSGKSTYASKIPNAIVISSDSVRKELGCQDCVKEDNVRVFSVVNERAKDHLKQGNNVVYDATNVNKKKRTAFLNELKNIPCRKVAVWMVTPLKMCVERNIERGKPVPNGAVKRMFYNFNPPDYIEGFDDIELIFPDGLDESGYVISDWLEHVSDFDQDNRYHSETLAEHSLRSCTYVTERSKKLPLIYAALLHDIGKPYTKSRRLKDGELDTQSHYFNHDSAGAYVVPLYLNADSPLSDREIVYAANLIFYHMRPFQFKSCPQAAESLKSRIGEEMFNDLMLLHDADVSASDEL